MLRIDLQCGIEVLDGRGPLLTAIALLAQEEVVERLNWWELLGQVSFLNCFYRNAFLIEAGRAPQVIGLSGGTKASGLIQNLQALLGLIHGLSQYEEELVAALGDLGFLCRRQAER